MFRQLDRRTLLRGGVALFGATLLGGCDPLSSRPWFKRILDKDEDANLYVQRLLLSQAKLAPEFDESEISPWFKPNGTDDPSDRAYKALAKNQFSTFRLELGGLVNQASSFSLADLRQMPSRTQITRHDCVEGWSCIGKWTGVPLSELLHKVGLKPQARFIVFHCADTMDNGLDSGSNNSDSTDTGDSSDGDQQGDNSGQAPQGDKGGTNGSMTKENGSKGQPDSGSKGQGGGQADAGKAASPKQDSKQSAPSGSDDQSSADGNGPTRYYESIDLEDAFHPQTILAYDMNGQTLPVPHGAPLRLRVERQLGYKMAKYVMRIEVVDSLDNIGQGGGGYWEDQGYEWYAGI